MGRVQLTIAWILATALAMGLAFGAVSIVAGDITDGPRELAASAPSVAAPATESVTPSTIGDATEPSTEDPEPASSASTSTEGEPSPSTSEDDAGPSTSEDDSTSTTEDDSTSTTEDDSTSTTEDDSTSTTEDSSSTTEGDATSSTDSSSTTTAPAAPITQTVSYDGNWARFSCTGETAGLEAYGAGTGYRLKEAPEVSGDSGKVEFESSDGAIEVELRVTCDGGTIETRSEVEG